MTCSRDDQVGTQLIALLLTATTEYPDENSLPWLLERELSKTKAPNATEKKSRNLTLPVAP